MIQDKYIIAIIAGWGAAMSYISGWSDYVWTLLILMCIDFSIGLAMPLFANKSKKSRGGKIESNICLRGIIKKCVIFVMVYVSYLLGKAGNVQPLSDAVCVAFIVSEVVSIVEHAAIIGVPIPQVLLRAINVVRDKTSSAVDALAAGALTPEKPEDKDKGNGQDA
jgi:toxin secretion/phage lysis holin